MQAPACCLWMCPCACARYTLNPTLAAVVNLVCRVCGLLLPHVRRESMAKTCPVAAGFHCTLLTMALACRCCFWVAGGHGGQHRQRAAAEHHVHITAPLPQGEGPGLAVLPCQGMLAALLLLLCHPLEHLTASDLPARTPDTSCFIEAPPGAWHRCRRQAGWKDPPAHGYSVHIPAPFWRACRTCCSCMPRGWQ